MTAHNELRRYTNLPVLIDILVQRRLTFRGYQHWVDANDRKALEVYQRALHYNFGGAACLTAAAETFHHWEVFAGGPAGVCIVFNRAPFEELFNDIPHFLAGPVEYVRLREIAQTAATDIHRLPFLKRWGFRHEEEYRVVAYAIEDRDCLDMPMPHDLIQRVVFSPFLPPRLVDSAKVALRSLSGWENLTIKHSHLTDNQTWQKALEEFPKRHGIVYMPWADLDVSS